MRGISLVIAMSLILAGCFPVSEASLSTSDQAALYNPSEFSMNSDFRIYHVTDEMSTVYIRLFPREMLFNQANNEGEYRAVISLDHSLYKLSEHDQIMAKVDSAVSYIKLGKKEQERSAFLTSLILPVPQGEKYLLKMKVSDTQRGTSGLFHIYIDKTNRYSAQNFSVISASSAMPKFMDYQRIGEVFSIRYPDRSIDTVYIDFFKNDYELPRPPVRRVGLSSFPIIRDSTLAIPFSDTLIYALPGEGMFQFRIDTLLEEGLSLFNFGYSYPQVKTEQDMIKPLFYIAYPVEYTALVNSDGDKMLLDEFWLRRSSNMDRSRELIRIYYNRVLYSNIFFTSDREGWKTDRGMVYILFGPPDRMKDTGTSQVWYYFSRRKTRVVEFKFNRDANHYTNKAFNLEKNPNTLGYLDDAIRSWNNGKVHSLRN